MYRYRYRYRSRKIIDMHNDRRVNDVTHLLLKHREKMRSSILMWISCILNYQLISCHKQFQRILKFYAKDKKDTTQDKKATTQDKKDIWGTKGTKRGHSGQKGRRGTFLVLCFSLGAGGVSRGTRARRFRSWNPASMDYQPFHTLGD